MTVPHLTSTLEAPRQIGALPEPLPVSETLELATALAQKVGAREVHTASLVARPGGFTPSFCALPTDALVVFPWDYEAVTEDERFDVDPDKAGA